MKSIKELLGHKGTRYRCLAFMGLPSYWVGEDGSVWWRSTKGIFKKRKASPVSRKDARLTICVRIDNRSRKFQVCHLVLRAFVGKKPCEDMEACHFPDRSLTNNRLTNLRWDTRINNFKDRDFHGTTVRGEKSPNAKLTEDKVRKIRRWYAPGKNPISGLSARQLAIVFAVDTSLIYLVLSRKIWAHVK